MMTERHQDADSAQRAGVPSVVFDEHMLIRPDSRVQTSTRDQAALVALLRSLYLAESRSVFRYLSNWQPYTNATTVRLRTFVKKLSAISHAHADRLSVMLQAVGGDELREGLFREDNTHFNYTSWSTMLPRLIEAKAEIIQHYQTVLFRLGAADAGAGDIDDPIVDELQLLVEENQRHLSELKKWHDLLANQR